MPAPVHTELIAGIRVRIFENRDAAEAAAAAAIAGLLDERRMRGTSVVLGLATGRTPVGIYRRLVERYRAREVSLSHAESFNLDEYWPIGLHDPGSFHRFMHENLFDHVDLPRGKRHVPDGSVDESRLDAHVAEYESKIRAAGGIDLQLLGLGRNGHIGFNEPGSLRESRTRRVDLATETIAANRPLFPTGTEPPHQAITMGIATILEARQILVLAFGDAKAEIVHETLRGPISPRVPASFLREHSPSGGGVEFFLDPAAAARVIAG